MFLKMGPHILTAILFVSLAYGETLTVKPGESIQAAVDAASSGDTIRVLPGEYAESVTLATEGIQLIGVIDQGDRPVLNGGGSALEGIRCMGNGARVEGFVIRNFLASGLMIYECEDTVASNLIIENAGYFGVNMTACTKSRVEGCVVSGHSDAGIYVARSTTVQVSNCESFENSSGLRLENSRDFVIENNSLHDNALGLALLQVPGRAEAECAYGRVFFNRLRANNRENRADPGGVAGAMISGVGLLLIGTDHVEVARNRFEENGSYAAMTLSLGSERLSLGTSLDGAHETSHFYMHHNAYGKNGTAPSEQFHKVLPDTPSGDLYWD